MIPRRDFLKGSALAALGALGSSGAALFADQKSNPAGSVKAPPASGLRKPGSYNVLWLMTDEHSPHVVGCYGNKIVRTPNLDALAASGVLMTNGYCQNPICVPSRTSFLTGRLASDLRLSGQGNDYDGPTMAKTFNAAGYRTAWFGKYHSSIKPEYHELSSDVPHAKTRVRLTRNIQDASISDWKEEEDLEYRLTEQGLNFLDENKNQAFFLGISFPKPHFPFTVFERFFKMYEGKLDAPMITQEILQNLPPVEKSEYALWGFKDLNESQIRFCREIYYGMVTYCDELLGKLIKKIDDLGLRENTIILYTSDHGEMLGEKGMWYKNSFYDASVRVPMIWSLPSMLAKSTILNTCIGNIDFFPTLCELCKLPAPTGITGQSVLPFFLGKQTSSERLVHSENFRGGFASKMVTNGRYKFIHYANKGPEILYDREKDPEESVNFFEDRQYKDIVADLRNEAIKDWKPRGGASLDSEDEQKTGKQGKSKKA